MPLTNCLLRYMNHYKLSRYFLVMVFAENLSDNPSPTSSGRRPGVRCHQPLGCRIDVCAGSSSFLIRPPNNRLINLSLPTMLFLNPLWFGNVFKVSYTYNLPRHSRRLRRCIWGTGDAGKPAACAELPMLFYRVCYKAIVRERYFFPPNW